MLRIIFLFVLFLICPFILNAEFTCEDNYKQIAQFPINDKCDDVRHLNDGNVDFITCNTNKDVFDAWMTNCGFEPYVEEISTPIEVVSLKYSNESCLGKKSLIKSIVVVTQGAFFNWDSEQFSGGIVFDSLNEKIYIHVLH